MKCDFLFTRVKKSHKLGKECYVTVSKPHSSLPRAGELQVTHFVDAKCGQLEQAYRQ